MTDSQETLMRILETTPLIVGDTHEQDRQFISDGRALAGQGLVKMGHDSNRGLYAIKITDAGRAALGTETAPREMTEAGFWTACASELQKHWPDMSLENADRWMRAFIGVTFGTVGHDWSREAAADIAACCACEFGEEP